MPVTINIPKQRKLDLLVSALEGGSNYWYDNARIYGNSFGRSLGRIEELCKTKYPDYHKLEAAPFVGGILAIDVQDSEEVEPEQRTRLLTEADFDRALQLMVDKYPHHFFDFLQENDDATTADVYLQLAMFGELIFG